MIHQNFSPPLSVQAQLAVLETGDDPLPTQGDCQLLHNL